MAGLLEILLDWIVTVTDWHVSGAFMSEILLDPTMRQNPKRRPHIEPRVARHLQGAMSVLGAELTQLLRVVVKIMAVADDK